MLSFDDLSFEERRDEAGNKVIRVLVYTFFYRDFPAAYLEGEIGAYAIKGKKLEIGGLPKERSEKKFMQLLRRYKRDMKYLLNGNKAVYLDEDAGLPLIGLNFLGILDKGSEILEIKPITNCNADCNFCSVNEGLSSDKLIDFVVDKDYLVHCTKELLAYKQAKGMSLWLNPHGEPTLYARLAAYCDDMLADDHVKDIHIITNGMLLTRNMADQLREIAEKHGKEILLSVSMSGIGSAPEEKTRLNKEGASMSKLMMGRSYNIEHVMKNLRYAITKLPITITPVLVHGMNGQEMKGIILFSKELAACKDAKKAGILIQKFCKNKHGRNPVKEDSWEHFFKSLEAMEQETHTPLRQKLGKLQETKQLPLLCKKGDKITAQIVCEGRYPSHRLGVLETRQGSRAVSLIGCSASKGAVKACVLESKYNMVLAKCGR